MNSARLSNRGNSQRIPHIIQTPLVLLFVLSTVSLFYFTSLDHTGNVHANGSGKLSGHVPGIIKSSHLLGPTDPNTPISLAVGLYLRNQFDLEAQVNGSIGPSIATGSRRLTSTQFAEAYAPHRADQDAVIALMRQAGFQVTRTFDHHLVIDVKGTIGQAEKVFKLQVNNYRAPDGRQFYAPATDPTVPASLAPIVQSVIGLDNLAHFTDTGMYASKPTHPKARPYIGNNPSPCQLSQPGYTPPQIAKAYNLNGLYNDHTLPTGYNGEGQTVGLFEFDNYSPSDISTYNSCFGLPGSSYTVPINSIATDTGGVPLPLGSDAYKVEADIEVVLSTAPKLASIQVYEAPNTAQGWIDQWSQILHDRVPVVSTGWVNCEISPFTQTQVSYNSTTQALYQQENTIFSAAAAQGMSIFAASGDSGNSGCQDGHLDVNDPASQQYVTGVGGTTLLLHTDSTHNKEPAWNDGTHASGGGISSIWQMPSWQQGRGVTTSGFSTGAPCSAPTGYYCRQVPDVSLDADPTVGYPIYCTVSASAPCNAGSSSPDYPWIEVGGTSMAAALWAGMTALANQVLVNDSQNTQHLTSLGFLNPMLYSIDQKPTQYISDFYDPQNGNNNLINDPFGKYQATAYYDMATGIGSYVAANLAKDLVALAITLPPGPSPTVTATITPTTTITPTITPTTPTVTTPPTSPGPPVNLNWYFAEGKVGGGFTEYITIENPDSVNSCQVDINYQLAQTNNEPSPVIVTVMPGTRFTESVNQDLSTSSLSPAYLAVSTIVKVDTTSTPMCKGVVAERPIYLTNFAEGISSGSDVLGATQLGKYFYFADIPTTGSYSSFITILNPSNGSLATVNVYYYSGGQQLGSQTVQVVPGTRGTINPTHFNQRAIAVVHSDQPVAVEVPTYFYTIPAGNAGMVTGAYSVVGAPQPASDWLFAEGYTGGQFQENLRLANFDQTQDVTATVTLEYQGGHTQKIQVPVPHNSQTVVNVNAYNATPSGQCDTSPCQVSADVSADVSTQSSTPIVVEREMLFHYNNGHGLTSTGGTDVTGMVGPPTASAFSFAEGYTNTGYNEWLTLQNPAKNQETVNLTIVNEYGHSYFQAYQLAPQSRTTVDITGLVSANLASPSSTYQYYEVSMTLQSPNNGVFVAERPMYWNAGSGLTATQGGSDVIGYSGG